MVLGHPRQPRPPQAAGVRRRAGGRRSAGERDRVGLRGNSVGEFRSWLHTILSRRIADYWQKRERTIPTQKLASEHQGSDEVWGEEPSVGFEGDALHAQECVRQALGELPEAHLEVVQLYVLGPHSATETATVAGDEMTEANVHQISSRFQKRVRELLDEGDTPR